MIGRRTIDGKTLILKQQVGYHLTADGQTLAPSWSEKLRALRAQALGSVDPAEARQLQRTRNRLSYWLQFASAEEAL
jgi:hypothetical protein